LIGFYGGSFDPFHLGHLHAAKILLEKNKFSKFSFVPAFQNPLKEKTAADNASRLEMLKAGLAEAGEPRFAVWDWEINRTEKSFTVESLEKMRAETSEEIALIVGNEVFAQFDQWKRPLDILNLANVIVIARTATDASFIPPVLREIGLKNFLDAGNQCFSHAAGTRWISLQTVEALPFTATAIREEIQQLWKRSHNPTPPHGIQRSVWLVIKEKRLYSVS
jgi:nicotinate-nucleotide adenylyltransferase